MAKKKEEKKAAVDPDKAAKRKARMEALKNRPAEQRPNSKQIDIIKVSDTSVVKNYGYYSVAANGVRWLYVKTSDGIVGFCSSAYLKKK